jgi:SAM-dependent methyltransferase
LATVSRPNRYERCAEGEDGIFVDVGIDTHTVAFLKMARAQGVNFSRTLTIGRQTAYGACHSADELLQELGATELDSLDASDYEGATIVHDLNTPFFSESLYTVVFDGGSLEHVFNFPQALANCLNLVEVGGHFVAAMPANNQLGHGFYQFSPELLWRCLSPDSGFRVEAMFLLEKRPLRARWYQALDPAIVGRAQLQTRHAVEMFVISRRESNIEPLRVAPQQSDYVALWAGGRRGGLKQRIRQRMPAKAAHYIDSMLAWRRTTWRNPGFRRMRRFPETESKRSE